MRTLFAQRWKETSSWCLTDATWVCIPTWCSQVAQPSGLLFGGRGLAGQCAWRNSWSSMRPFLPQAGCVHRAVSPPTPFQPATSQSGRVWKLFLVSRASCLPIGPLELPENFLQTGWTSRWNLFWQLTRDCHKCSSKSSIFAYCSAAGVALSRSLQNLDGLVCLCLNCVDF